MDNELKDKFYFLNDIERELVEAFYKNETQREAVKKVLLMGIYNNGVMKAGIKHNPQMNWALSLAWKPDGTRSDALEVGESLQIVAEGIKSVELAFKELSKFNKPAPVTAKKNLAR